MISAPSARRSHRRTRLLAGPAAALLLVLTGCTSAPDDDEPATPADQSIEVDTPELRAAKRQTDLPACHSADAEPVSDGMPEVTLACLGGGGETDLAGLRGPMVVNLWAAWCGPCREELPVFQEFHHRYGDEVAVLGIDFQDNQVKGAIELAGDSGLSYPNLADPSGLINGRGKVGVVQGLPRSIFIDADGTVTASVPVVVEDVGQLRDLVDEHLGVSL